MSTKKLRQAEYRVPVLKIFGDSFNPHQDKRFKLLNEFDCTQKLDTPIKPTQFQVLTDSVSLKKILRMSWNNTSNVPLKKLRMNITASNATTEWRAKDLEFDVSENSEGVTEKFGIIIPDSAEKITVEITYVELEDGLYWDKSGEFFSFAVNSQDGIFLTDANGDRIIETKTKPGNTQHKTRKNRTHVLLFFVCSLSIILSLIAIFDLNIPKTENTNFEIPGIGTTNTTDTAAHTIKTSVISYTSKSTIKFTTETTHSTTHSTTFVTTHPTTHATTHPTTVADPSKLVIFLDPGHGGNDPGVTKEYDFYDEGTSYENTTYKEADISLAVALKAKAKLEALGYQVILSRTGDTFVEVTDRPIAALNANASMFISIHVNSASGDFAKGFEAYYSGKTDLGYDAKAFADLFTKEFAEILDIPNSNKPEEPAYPNMTIRGTKADTDLYTNGLAVLNQKESLMPSTLLELGFISNKNDAFMLQSTYWQNFAAQAIADAVVAAHNAGMYKK